MTGRTLKSGSHIARMAVVEQPDGTYEAQVYVRLTREPELAETYIPAGIFPTADEAWEGARQRATRALSEHEF
ncbi:MAG: hypothetical protein WA924_00385 [Burkholderiaceae bacterium]